MEPRKTPKSRRKPAFTIEQKDFDAVVGILGWSESSKLKAARSVLVTNKTRVEAAEEFEIDYQKVVLAVNRVKKFYLNYKAVLIDGKTPKKKG
jgi:hypothetical protein